MWGRSPTRHADAAPPVPAEPEPDLVADDPSSRLRAALDLVGEGIIICDADGEVLFRNAAAAQQLSGRPSDALAVQAITEMTQEALIGHAPERRLDLVTPTRRSLSIRAFPITGASHITGDSRIDGAVAVIEDITERLRLESIRRDFVANVSHELKTPTGALALLAETIDGESNPQTVARLARMMGLEAERLTHIIDDLLDLSRIEANETTSSHLVPVDVLIEEAVQSKQSFAASLDVTLNVDDVVSGWAVSGDRRDLISAVSNLVDNAAKYSEGGGSVQISTRHLPSGHIEIAVTDEGVGIPSRDLERIFERFYRVDRARSRSTGGTGLGLSIVRHVAANHGGWVSVRSKEGEGSTFLLTLPAIKAPAQTEPEGEGDAGSG